MPYVTERFTPPRRSFKITRGGTSGFYTVSLLNGRHKQQFGYRSGPMTKEEQESLNGLNLTWKDTRSVIDLLDRDEFARPTVVQQHRSRIWMVNDRDYEETMYNPHGFNGVFEVYRPPNKSVLAYSRAVTGVLGISGVNAGIPAWPSDIQSIAGSLLRSSRPPQSTFNLARFTLEGRDAPLLLKAANYIPRSKSELGGAYLNWLFGIKPTASDLCNAADLILRTERHISSHLEREKVVEKSSRSRVLYEASDSGRIVLSSYADTYLGATITTGRHSTFYVYLTHSGATMPSDNLTWPVLSWEYTAHTRVRTFATWEYFVPKPHDISTRLKRYRKNAELILGSAKVDAATVYELAPWSWMADWFVDVGGLLRYQQAIADNGIVSSGCGYSVFNEYLGSTSYTECVRDVRGDLPNTSDNVVRVQPKVVTTVRYKKQQRRSGSPYSISPDWDLSPQQAAITGALGLSRNFGSSTKRS